MLRRGETVYRSKLADLRDEFPDLLESDVDVDVDNALEHALRRCRWDATAEGDATGGSSDFASAIT
ncbi:hypothetical protein Asp14428_44500 [Actinoplanes sp. NBRC 14428]|nr:hypothetical protein Asp14428_44500 [Actinoplanes sp. NBRC 14428]